MKKVYYQLLLGLMTFSLLASSAIALSPVPISMYPTLPPHLSTDDVWLTQGIASPSTNTTPSFKFHTEESGGIVYSGACSSNNASASVGENTITLNELTPGTYNDCKFHIFKLLAFPSYYESNTVSIPSFTIIAPAQPDTTAPTLTLNSAPSGNVTDRDQNLSFESSEAGTYDFTGSCVQYASNNLPPYGMGTGEAILLLTNLDYGTYDDCQISVTDAANNTSDVLSFPSFTVVDPNAADTTAPIVTLVQGVNSPTTDTTPSIIISSNEAGTINYYGACGSSTSSMSAGNKTITIDTLSVGTYNNCALTVTDSSNNESNSLNIPSFTIQSGTTSQNGCGNYSDLSSNDTDCDAIEYVKSIGAMTGNPDGTFDPSGLLQRDQISKIALETFDNYSSGVDYCDNTIPFPDVNQSDWSYQYVCRAKSLDVITGYKAGADTGYFRPARSVNRAEFLAIILRNLNETMPTGVSYSDVSSTDWFYGYARYSKIHDLFVGTFLYPSAKVSRREVAQVLYTLHQDGVI